MSQRKRQPITDGIPAAGPSPDELAERYLSLVIPIARSFQKRLPSSVDFDDLVGVGNLGLVEAARRSGLLQSSASSFPQDPRFKLGCFALRPIVVPTPRQTPFGKQSRSGRLRRSPPTAIRVSLG